MQIKLFCKRLGHAFDAALALAGGEDIGIGDFAELGAEVSERLCLFARDGLEFGRLVDDRRFVVDFVDRDDGADAVVLMSVVFDEGDDDVVNVMVDFSIDHFTFVDNLMLDGGVCNA